MTQSEKAALFRQLHHGLAILRLANVWDAASARIVAHAGYPAIATGSAGVAFALGYTDSEEVPLEEMLAAIRRIVRVVPVPVSADLMAGYGDIERTIEGLIATGAVGVNVEDFQNGALVEIPRQIEKIRAIRRTGERLGVPVVINARCDIFLAHIGDSATQFDRTVERLTAYQDAGADCLFVPGVTDEPTIARLVQALRFPLNVLAGPGMPTVPRLQEIGVARLSVGSGPIRAVMGLTRRIAEELRDAGTYTRMLDGAIPYKEANELFR